MGYKRFAVLLLFFCGAVAAKELQLLTHDGQRRAFALDSIAAITFTRDRTGALLLSQGSGKTTEVLLTDVEKILFAEATAVAAGRTQPTSFVLYQNVPNPFNPQTTIAFELAAPASVTLLVYNAYGRYLTTLAEAPLLAGAYRVNLDGRDENGSPAASGVYFYELVAGYERQVKKCLLIH